jgi:hypothetical protein
MSKSRRRTNGTKTSQTIDVAANPYLDEFKAVWQWLRSKNSWIGQPGLRGLIAWWLTYFHRMYIILIKSKATKNKYGFGILNDAAVERLAQFGELVDMGAGLGYIAWLLRKRGVKVHAFDKFNRPGEEGSWFPKGTSNWTEVRQGDTSVLKQTRYKACTVVLCYPAGKMGIEALDDFEGDSVALISTSQAIAIADAAFHYRLDEQWDLVDAVPIPGWLDFNYRVRHEVPLHTPWRKISSPRLDVGPLYIPAVNYGTNLFIFKKRGA